MKEGGRKEGFRAGKGEWPDMSWLGGKKYMYGSKKEIGRRVNR